MWLPNDGGSAQAAAMFHGGFVFGRTKAAPAFIRACRVYLSDTRQAALVAPMFNHAGLFAERPGAVIEGPLREADQLGRSARIALEECVWQPEFNYRGRKRSDWPAFHQSGCRSMREFESDYASLLVCGANEANLTWEVRSAPVARFDIGTVGSVSAAVPDSDLGECLLAVWESYQYLRKRPSTVSSA